MPRQSRSRRWWGPALALAVAALAAAAALSCVFRPVQPAARRQPAAFEPRKAPRRFPKNTHMPSVRESAASGAVDPSRFDPRRDLVRFTDYRVWFESDRDTNDDEDDHLIHRSVEAPLRRLIDLLQQRKEQLRIHDAYRPKGVHSIRSLHREGRALDLTSEKMSLAELAKLCWVAGFDWVYYEAGKGGEHVHVSVKP
jgi:hypothetical protein